MRLRLIATLSVLFLIVSVICYLPASSVAAAGKTMTVVGLYSETDAGHVSYRVGGGGWTIIKLGDQIPESAEIGITVDRDWVELIPSDNLNAVYEIDGDVDGKPVNMKVTDLLKEKPRTVGFPKGANDPKFVNKVVVKQYLGRHTYRKNDNSRLEDVKYGAVLVKTGTVNMIAINTTLTLVLPNTKEKTVIGPLRFTIAKLLKGENLYKFLNVAK